MAGLIDVESVLKQYPKTAASDNAQKVLSTLSGDVKAASLSGLNATLQPNVFFNGNQFTVDDLHLYAALHKAVSGFGAADRLAVTNVTRWFDNIQHLPGVSAALSLPVVQIERNLATVTSAAKKPAASAPATQAKSEEKKPEAAPAKQQPKAEEKKGQQQQQKKGQQQQQKKGPVDEEKAAAIAKAKAERAAAAKEKAAQQPKQPKATPAKQQAPADPRTDIEHLDIRVGQIVSVKRHPNADALYVEEINLGEGKPRTIISGLVNFVPIEEMENRRVLVLANLKPRAMRGIESHGMVLCASNSDKTKVEPLLVPEGLAVGERVFFGEAPSPHKPDDELNPKKKYFETVQPDWKTDDNRVARYKDLAWNTAKGYITAATISGGTIS